MSTTVQVQYRNEFVLGFSQRQSLLKECVTKEMVIKGNQAVFLIANTTNRAVTRGVNGLIPAHDNNNSQVTATLLEKHDLGRMTGFNIFQSQADQRAIMQMNSMSAINLDVDQSILNALGTATLTTGAAATASPTMISKAMVGLQNNGVPWDGNVYAIISAAFLEYMMLITTFTSADWVNVKPNVNFPGLNATDATKAGQGWYEWKGVKWIVSSLIAGLGTASETCFMFHSSAIGHAVASGDMQSVIGYNDEQDYSFARCTLNHGSVLLQNKGVAKMLHDGSAFGIS